MQILGIDIGGTKTVVALCLVDGHKVQAVSHKVQFQSRNFHSLAAIIESWQQQFPKETFAAVGAGIAGPVLGGRCHVTNLGWTIDQHELSKQFRTPIILCNDMEAHGWGLLQLTRDDIHVLNSGNHSDGGTKALIAAGTGLGESIIGWDGRNHLPLGGEGGHASYSPCSDMEIRLLQWLRAKFKGHVSWERVLGGRDGFRNLTEFMIHDRTVKQPAWVPSQDTLDHDWGPAVISAAMDGDPLAEDVVLLYAELYGREASNLALKCVPVGGLYLGGGIAVRILPWLERAFMRGFLDKGRFSSVLQSIPVLVILDPINGLKGAAVQATIKGV